MNTIRQAQAKDALLLAEIYNYYIQHTTVTFEETPISKDEIWKRVMEVLPQMPWLVYEQDDEILGYAYANQWKNRSAYRHSAEVTVYLKHTAIGKGIGTLLYQDLFGRLETMKFHAIMGGIALPNEGSIALHEKFGLKKVAHFKEVGFKSGKWIDVGYWQLIKR